MSSWSSLFQRPTLFEGEESAANWFGHIGERLLNESHLLVGNQPHRLTEVEVYYYGQAHKDPFAHRDPIQLHCGRWYFHRSHGAYRSGSFKGLDLSFGDGDNYGGVLIRGLEKPDGALIDGPSLCVDYLLEATGSDSVSQLDRAIGTRVAWEKGNILFLDQTEETAPSPIWRSGRVGLSLKRSRGNKEMQRYLLKPYRYLIEPQRIAKGKLFLVLALHAQGRCADEVRTITGCGRTTVERYLAEFRTGQEQPDFAPFLGKDLTPADLCRLHGVWYAHYGSVSVS